MDDFGLEPRILEAVRALGIESFTEPQEKAIPRIRSGANVLLVAPTGIGKTEAALLPVLDHIVRETPPPTSCLYITPLRALNRDMLRRMTFFAERLGVRVAVRHGDTSPQERAAITRHPPDILITTPETFQILFTGRRLREHLRSIRWVVVDEIHELASDERGAQLAVGLERLRDLVGHEFQRIGLSATVGSPEEVAAFLGGVDRDVEVIRVRIPKGLRIRVEMPAPSKGDTEISERLRVQVGQATALRRCYELIKEHASTLFFVNTRDTAEFLSSRLAAWYQDPTIGVHHGSLSKDVRVQMEDDFKAGTLRALVCTSSLELGIDVGGADFVLQYNSPREVSRLVQRIGRSGHGVGEVSDGVILATHEDDVSEACAIARRALAEEIEALVVRKDNRSVLANQLVAIAVSERFASADQAYDTVRRSWPFRDLNRKEFDDVLAQLADLRILWSRDGRLGRSSNSLPYFFENISMIPDVRTYRVIDLSSRRVIGTLDEWFVAENAKLGQSFIMRGTAWRFVDFKEDHVLVEPVKEIGDVPSWVGEDIPVPFEVAQEVGRVRREKDFSAYPLNDHGASKFLEYLGSAGDAPVATDRRITIEAARDVIIVNACLGSRVNETLGQLISSLVSARFGQSVGVQTDPYRVVLEVPRSVNPKQIVEILQPEDPDALEPLLRVILKNSAFLRWAFVYVAKKFGALRRDVDWESVSIPRLLKTFENTPLFEEVLDKVFWERMDIPRTVDVLKRIRTGEIELVVTKPTPIGRAGLEGGRLLVTPSRADHATLMAVKARLEKETATLLCLSCKMMWREGVKDLPAKIRCPRCSAVMIAVVAPYEKERIAKLDLEGGDKESRAKAKRLFTNASLVMAHGRKAVLALMARGVGEDTAARILRGYHESEEDFLREVLAAEITYARTKRFWD
ncbi:MAG: DEAD/DEAH box helicase [Methanobacteriota archaeon]|nr:MAG: DEAD/DEAH box helicase [Euryarchaeota archaeon]